MLVWTFILERTVVVCLASTYPKTDLQSRGALYENMRAYRRWSESARRRANDVLVKRPLIRLRHLLPQLKSAGGEGLSIGGTAENEPLAQPHIVPSFATNRVPAIPLSV